LLQINATPAATTNATTANRERFNSLAKIFTTALSDRQTTTQPTT
jgi:hypothetical protein